MATNTRMTATQFRTLYMDSQQSNHEATVPIADTFIDDFVEHFLKEGLRENKKKIILRRRDYPIEWTNQTKKAVQAYVAEYYRGIGCWDVKETKNTIVFELKVEEGSESE